MSNPFSKPEARNHSGVPPMRDAPDAGQGSASDSPSLAAASGSGGCPISSHCAASDGGGNGRPDGGGNSSSGVPGRTDGVSAGSGSTAYGMITGRISGSRARDGGGRRSSSGGALSTDCCARAAMTRNKPQAWTSNRRAEDAVADTGCDGCVPYMTSRDGAGWLPVRPPAGGGAARDAFSAAAAAERESQARHAREKHGGWLRDENDIVDEDGVRPVVISLHFQPADVQ